LTSTDGRLRGAARSWEGEDAQHFKSVDGWWTLLAVPEGRRVSKAPEIPANREESDA
jgi:hypothetical protein